MDHPDFSQHQTLTGAAGSDVFVFNFAGVGHDTVTDFNLKVDKIDFEGLSRAASFRDLIIHGNSAGDAVVEFAGNSMTLTGLHLASLSAQNFLFNQGNPARGRAAALSLRRLTGISGPFACAAQSTGRGRLHSRGRSRARPGFAISRALANWTASANNPKHLVELEPIRERVRKAGVPEQ